MDHPTHAIGVLIELRRKASTRCGWVACEVPIGVQRHLMGLVETCGHRSRLTPAGWELAERIIAAAADEVALYWIEQAGTLTPEQAERRHVA